LLGGLAPPDAFARVSGWVIVGAGAAAQLGERATAIRSAVDATASAVAASDPAALADRLRTQLAGPSVAINDLPAGPARLQLEASLTIDVPLAQLADMRVAWRTYQDLLTTAGQATRDLGAEGFSEVGATAQRIATAASPLTRLGEFVR